MFFICAGGLVPMGPSSSRASCTLGQECHGSRSLVECRGYDERGFVCKTKTSKPLPYFEESPI